MRDGVLTFGTDFAYPPFAFDDPETGEPTGFEVDLAGALADQMGLELLLVNRNTAALISGLLAERHDLASSALVDSERLLSEVCVSSGYLAADLGLLARSGDPPSVTGTDALEGRTIGVVVRSRAEAWARAEAPGAALRRYQTSDDLLAAVTSSEVDGAVDELPLLRYARRTTEGVTVVEAISTGSSYVIAAGPGNRGLVELVDEALRRITQNGKLATIQRKWFGG